MAYTNVITDQAEAGLLELIRSWDGYEMHTREFCAALEGVQRALLAEKPACDIPACYPGNCPCEDEDRVIAHVGHVDPSNSQSEYRPGWPAVAFPKGEPPDLPPAA